MQTQANSWELLSSTWFGMGRERQAAADVAIFARDLARCVRNLLLCSAPFFRSHTVILMFINAALPDPTMS